MTPEELQDAASKIAYALYEAFQFEDRRPIDAIAGEYPQIYKIQQILITQYDGQDIKTITIDELVEFVENFFQKPSD